MSHFKKSSIVKNTSPCIVEGCTGIYHAKGYCKQHYRQYITGRPITLIVKTAKKYDKYRDFYCSLEGCWSKRKTRGLCHKHYQQWLKQQTGSRVCSIEGCNGRHVAKGCCQKHYDQFKTNKLTTEGITEYESEFKSDCII